MISVIIPTYNNEKGIEKCVDSILKQTFSDLEILICDDCSTDGTWKKLLEIKEKDNRIQIVKNDKNRKSAYTRNRLFNLAKSEYIAQIDSDDYCSLDRIQKQKDFLDENLEYAFVGSNAFIWDENGIYGESTTVSKPELKDFLKTSPYINPSIMFRKQALNAVNGYRVAKETARSQDYDLFLRLFTAGHYGFNIQENLVYYYQNKDYIQKIKFRHRLGEMSIRYYNFKKMGILYRHGIFIFKPLLTFIIPNKILDLRRNITIKNNKN